MQINGAKWHKYSQAIEKYRKEGKMMKTKGKARIIALIGITLLLVLLLPGIAAAMEIELAEYRPPSAGLLGPGESDSFGIDAEPATETAVPSVPETVSENQVPSIDYISLWTGEWILAEDPESFLNIMPGEDGKLDILAMFNQMIGVEAEVVPHDGQVIIFNGDFKGSLVRGAEDSIALTISVQYMNADNEFYDFFVNRVFVFTKDGKPIKTGGDENQWASRMLMATDDIVVTGKPDEKYPVSDTYEFEYDGALQSWRHYEKNDSGSVSISRYGGYTYLYEYDENGRQSRDIDYQYGIITEMTEYAYNNDGKKVLEHRVSYSDDEVRHVYRYYDYDASGRQTATRMATELGGATAVEAAYEYAEDGTYKETQYYVKKGNQSEVAGVIWYDSKGRETQDVYYVDGEIWQKSTYQYDLDEQGRVIRKAQTITEKWAGQSDTTRTFYTDYVYDENGVKTAEISSYDFDPLIQTKTWLRNEENRVVCEYESSQRADGEIDFVELKEYDLDPVSYRTLCTRGYKYGYSYRGREAQSISFTVSEGDQGTRLGISPLPVTKGEMTYSFSMDTLKNNIKSMSRDDITRSSYMYPVGDSIYDSDAAFDFYGYPGAIRFVFTGKTSNRLQSIWWVCRDESASAEEIYAVLERNGVDWNGDIRKQTLDMLGTRSTEGYFEEGWVRLAEVSYNDEKLVYLYFRFTWSEPEEGLVQPWEMNPSDFRTSDAQPVDEPIIESIEDPVDKSSGEGAEETAEAPVSDELPDYSTLLSNGDLLFDYGLVAFESPGDTEPMVAKMNEDGVSSFIRAPYQDEYRDILQRIFPEASEEELRERTLTIANIFTTVLDGDQDAETVAWNRYDSPDYERGFVMIAGRTARMIRSRDNAGLPYVTTEYDIPLSGNRILSILIPVYEDGTLEDAQKLFLETLDIRDSLYAEPPAGSNNTSTDETNIPDYQEESTATPTTEPTATPTAEPTATPTAEPTAIPTAEPTATPTPEPTATPTPEPTVTPTPIPEPIVTPEPVPAPDYSGWLGTWRAVGSGHESTMIIMENGAGGLNMFVTLDNRITISSALEPVENGMMDFDNGDVNGLLTMDQDHVLWMTDVGSFLDDVNNWMDNFGFVVEYHVPGETSGPQQGIAAPNDSTPTEIPAPAQSTIALVPVAGRSDVMQVPILFADATSWIVGKDPNAYIPYRMIDGEETTAFQVSTKTTKLGEIYLYFNFREPMAIDELWIKNGYWKKTDGLDQYTRNSRIKEMTVDFCYGNEGDYRDGQKVTLKDDKKRKDWQVVELGRKTSVTSVRICVKSIYQGTKYKTDVCISEVMFIQRPGN